MLPESRRLPANAGRFIASNRPTCNRFPDAKIETMMAAGD